MVVVANAGAPTKEVSAEMNRSLGMPIDYAAVVGAVLHDGAT